MFLDNLQMMGFMGQQVLKDFVKFVYALRSTLQIE